jgi:ATP-binding cassette subfamily F protein 3
MTRGQRIAIIGPNGAGKTTLLKILAGELAADTGKVALGHHVKLGYFAQHHADTLHPDSTPFQEVSEIDANAGMTRVRTVLGAFLFSGDDVDKKIRVLSGGERARVALARMLLKPGNLLMMDEPTNHLDLASAESLAESLTDYDGTLLFVSHNRSFVKRLATQIWNLEEGRLDVYPGTLDEYMYAQRERQEARERAGDGSTSGSEPNAKQASQERANRGDDKERKRREAEQRAQRNKVLKPLKERVAQLEAKIEKLEAAQRAVTEQLSDGAVYADAARRGALLADFESQKRDLDKLTAQWEALTLEIEAKEAALEG